MMSNIYRCEKKTLGLAFIVGMSFNGSWDALFSSVVQFSLFPLISLVLAIYCLHQRYLNQAMPEGIPSLVTASFFLGWFSYTAIIRVTYQQLGSNFVAILICMALLFWMGYRVKQLNKYAVTEGESE